MEINFYWHGEPMSDLNKACIRSWADRGFKPLLWSYQNIQLDFAEAKDAREVMQLDEAGHPALFADGFRYKLLHERGGCWVDADILCNTNELKFTETTFASEHGQKRDTWQTNCFIYGVQGCEILNGLFQAFKKVSRPLVWGSTGPTLITRLAMKQKVNILPPEAFCLVPWWEFRRLGRGPFHPDLSRSLGLHLWHEMWRRHGGVAYDKQSVIGKLINNQEK